MEGFIVVQKINATNTDVIVLRKQSHTLTIIHTVFPYSYILGMYQQLMCIFQHEHAEEFNSISLKL